MASAVECPCPKCLSSPMFSVGIWFSPARMLSTNRRQRRNADSFSVEVTAFDVTAFNVVRRGSAVFGVPEVARLSSA